MMQLFQLFAIVLSTLQICGAFQQIQVSNRAAVMPQRSSTTIAAITSETIEDVGYVVSVEKPLGVVFGNNPGPYFGLVVDEVAEGQNGAEAGIRVGDQLLAVNGEVAVGKDFDLAMGFMQKSPSRMDLKLYRGTVSSLFTILVNRIKEGDSLMEEEDDEGEEPVIMDENYESPVRIEVKERKPLGVGDVFKALKKVGTMALESDGPKKEKPKGSGFFGIGSEAIQLDGDDANTLK